MFYEVGSVFLGGHRSACRGECFDNPGPTRECGKEGIERERDVNSFVMMAHLPSMLVGTSRVVCVCVCVCVRVCTRALHCLTSCASAFIELLVVYTAIIITEK